MKFEEKLSKLRKQNALSQEELAEKLNVSRQTISKWELGQTKPDSGKIMEIASLFNVSTDELLDDTSDVNNTRESLGEQNEKKPLNAVIIAILVVGLILAIGYICFWIFTSNFVNVLFNNTSSIINDTSDIIKQGINESKDRIEQGHNEMEKKGEGFNSVYNQAQNIIGNAQDSINQGHNEMEKREEEFNSGYNQVLETMQEMKEKSEQQQNESKARQERAIAEQEERQKQFYEQYNEILRKQQEF